MEMINLVLVTAGAISWSTLSITCGFTARITTSAAAVTMPSMLALFSTSIAPQPWKTMSELSPDSSSFPPAAICRLACTRPR